MNGKNNLIRTDQTYLRKENGAAGGLTGLSRPLYQTKYNIYSQPAQADLGFTRQKTTGDSRQPKTEFIVPQRENRFSQQIENDMKATVARPEKSWSDPDSEKPADSNFNQIKVSYQRKEQSRLLEDIDKRLSALGLSDSELQEQVSGKSGREIQTESVDERLRAMAAEVEALKKKVSSRKGEIASLIEENSKLEKKLMAEIL